MDAIASGRVPVELKKQGAVKLEMLGCTVTDLINAAYEYLVATGELPSVLQTSETGSRGLPPEKIESFKTHLAASSVVAPDSWTNMSFEDLRDEAMRMRYSNDLFDDCCAR